MEVTEIIIDGEVYTITTLDSGHVIKELKMTDEQKLLILNMGKDERQAKENYEAVQLINTAIITRKIRKLLGGF